MYAEEQNQPQNVIAVKLIEEQRWAQHLGFQLDKNMFYTETYLQPSLPKKHSFKNYFFIKKKNFFLYF